MIINLTNERLSFRYHLNIDVKMIFKNKSYNVVLTNMNVIGAQITFSDNETLFDLLEDIKVLNIEFEYDEKIISIESNLIYINIYDVGERNFYTHLGIEFKKESFNKYKDILLNLLVSIEMKNFFIYKDESNIKESLLG